MADANEKSLFKTAGSETVSHGDILKKNLLFRLSHLTAHGEKTKFLHLTKRVQVARNAMEPI